LKYKAMNVIARFFGNDAVANAVMPVLYGKTAPRNAVRGRFRHSMRSAGARIGGKDIGAPVTAEKRGTRCPRAELITSRRRRTVAAEQMRFASR
jgi:hypothetical protein